MIRKPLIAVAVAAACAYSYADNADITVTYSDFTQPLSQTTGQVRILSREEIELIGTNSIDQLLNQVAGVSVSSQGGLGQVSSIRVRGSDTGDVLILTDGIPITDTTDIDLNAKTSILNSLSIERIEIVKGNQSAVWGSQAVGGVINIITSSPDDVKTRVEIGAGSYGQKSTQAISNLSNDSTQIAISAGYLEEDGFSALERRIDSVSSRSDAQAGLEKDPYREKTLRIQAQTQISNTQELGVSVLDVDSFINYDDSFTPDFNATSENDTELTQLMLFHQAKVGSGELIKSQLSKTTNERTQFGGYKGSQASLSSRYQTLSETRNATYGVTVAKHTLDLSAGSKPTINEFETYEVNTVQNWRVGSTDFDAALAYEFRSKFENGATHRLGFKHQFQREFALGANVSSGFKAPSLYQLDYGVTTGLRPEKSESAEVYVETRLGSLTAFISNVNDRIVYTGTWPNDRYSNESGESETEGWEYSHRFNSSPSTSHSVSHTYVEAKDAANARRVRIPETETTFKSIWAVSDPLLIGLDIRHTGSRLGNSDDLETGNFTVSDLFGNYQISAKTELSARIENITDVFYQDAVNASSGYATRRRGYYLTLRSEF
jgi:vitamin B12 transporter